MNHPKKNHPSNKKQTANHVVEYDPKNPLPWWSADAELRRFMRLAAAGQYEEALRALGSGGKSPQVQNARGVCLLRLGRANDAASLFRSLVMLSGCTWMRPDIPTVYKVNWATALLLAGHPGGCLEALDEINDETFPAVPKLRAAIKAWTRTLSFWQRLNWWMGRIEPNGRPVAIDFVPGNFDFDMPGVKPEHPQTQPPVPQAA